MNFRTTLLASAAGATVFAVPAYADTAAAEAGTAAVEEAAQADDDVSRGEGFDLFGWVRNAFDKKYIEPLQVAPGNVGLIAGTPGDQRTWGGTIKFNF